MSDASDPGDAPGRLSAAEREARRRRLARVFGEVLPEQTKDDQGEPADRPPSSNSTDDWYHREKPPHHGD